MERAKYFCDFLTRYWKACCAHDLGSSTEVAITRSQTGVSVIKAVNNKRVIAENSNCEQVRERERAPRKRRGRPGKWAVPRHWPRFTQVGATLPGRSRPHARSSVESSAASTPNLGVRGPRESLWSARGSCNATGMVCRGFGPRHGGKATAAKVFGAVTGLRRTIPAGGNSSSATPEQNGSGCTRRVRINDAQNRSQARVRGIHVLPVAAGSHRWPPTARRGQGSRRAFARSPDGPDAAFINGNQWHSHTMKRAKWPPAGGAEPRKTCQKIAVIAISCHAERRGP